MMPVFEQGLAVSLPGAALLPLKLPGSVFGPEVISDAVLDADLRLAINLLMEALPKEAPVRFIARPEIFTHGVARTWLDERLGGIQDHVALCDGSSFRPIAGLRNHLFFYMRSSTEHVAEARRLFVRAPELIYSMSSQINSGLRFTAGGRVLEPPLLPLRAARTQWLEPTLGLPLVCWPGRRAQASRIMIEELEEGRGEPPDPDRHWFYIPLSAAALDDREFMKDLAHRVLAASFGQTEGVLLGLPGIGLADDGGAADSLTARIGAVLAGLERSGMAFPIVETNDVQILTGLPTPEAVKHGTLIIHPGLDFWRLSDDLMDAFDTIVTFEPSLENGRFRALFSAWLGRDVEPLMADDRGASMPLSFPL